MRQLSDPKNQVSSDWSRMTKLLLICRIDATSFPMWSLQPVSIANNTGSNVHSSSQSPKLASRRRSWKRKQLRRKRSKSTRLPPHLTWNPARVTSTSSVSHYSTLLGFFILNTFRPNLRFAPPSLHSLNFSASLRILGLTISDTHGSQQGW